MIVASLQFADVVQDILELDTIVALLAAKDKPALSLVPATMAC